MSSIKDKLIVVSVNEGKVRGIKQKSSFSRVEFYSFYGIPYGQSTAGHARFKNPVKVKPWKNILNCTEEKTGCLQLSLRKKEITGTEDCLYNNIHTAKIPDGTTNPQKAVIVCYHPGGLAHGSPDPCTGFLNLGLEECSGNQGVKDVILSLQWIKENISFFGGDPENITIMGSGTGADLVHTLMVSPKSKGLFHKAILMGMYKYCPLHLAAEENATLAFSMAKELGYVRSDEHDRKRLLSFYKKLNIDDLITSKPEMFFFLDKSVLYVTSPFVTTVDSGETAVLSSSREEQIKSTARIPIMVGFCEREASMGFSRQYKKYTMKNFYKLMRSNHLGWGHNLSDDKIKLIQQNVEKFYLEGKSIENASLSTKCDILTDAALSDVYDSLVNIISSDLPFSVYIYKFNFEGNAFTMNEYISSEFEEPLSGTCHESDFIHWASTEYRYGQKTDSLSSKTREMIETFTKLVTQFAKSGNPNYQGASVEWKPSMVEKPCYLRVDDNLQMIDGKLNGQRVEFWENLKNQCLY